MLDLSYLYIVRGPVQMVAKIIRPLFKIKKLIYVKYNEIKIFRFDKPKIIEIIIGCEFFVCNVNPLLIDSSAASGQIFMILGLLESSNRE